MLPRLAVAKASSNGSGRLRPARRITETNVTGRDASWTGVHADHQPTSTALGTTSTLVSSPSVLRIAAAAAALTAVHRTGQVSHPAIAPMIRTQPSRPVQRECTVATTGTPRPAATWATRVEKGHATERWRCTTSYDVSWRPRGRIGNGTGDHDGARITSTGPGRVGSSGIARRGQHGDVVTGGGLPDGQLLDEHLDPTDLGPVVVRHVQDARHRTSLSSSSVGMAAARRTSAAFRRRRATSQPPSHTPPTGISSAKVKPR